MSNTRPLLVDSEHVEPVDELASVHEGLGRLRREFEAFKKDHRDDWANLGKMLQSARVTFGGNVQAATASGAPQPPDESAWNMWKQRLPGACPKVIDALLIQPLTATQLIAATGTSYSTVQRAINVLEGNSLIEREGTRIRLKRL